MKQTITAKLKLSLSQEQKELLRTASLAYRDGLNYTSGIAFEMNCSSSPTTIQKVVYRELRDKFSLPSQMACNIPRQVAASYKTQWTKYKQNKLAREKGKTKKRYKGLDTPMEYSSRTLYLSYGRDFSLVKGQVSIGTLKGRIKVDYQGYNKHLDYIRQGTRIGGAKVWYCKSSKTYYLLVPLEIEVADVKPDDIKKVVGVDVGQRCHAVITDAQNNIQFYHGGETNYRAEHYKRVRQRLQAKGTPYGLSFGQRSATRKLIALSGRERRFKRNRNHDLSSKIATSNTLIGLENLTNIRESTNRRSNSKASKKQRRANRNQSKWGFAELHSFIDYKAVLNSSMSIKVDAHYTSQQCVKCGHTSKNNRPDKGLMFDCECCGYKLHSDLVGARNICMRTMILRQDLSSTGLLSVTPDVSKDEGKADNLKRFSVSLTEGQYCAGFQRQARAPRASGN